MVSDDTTPQSTATTAEAPTTVSDRGRRPRVKTDGSHVTTYMTYTSDVGKMGEGTHVMLCLSTLMLGLMRSA